MTPNATSSYILDSPRGCPAFPLDFLPFPEAPDSVNPSLWHHARLELVNGLFHVTGGIYQVRTFDVSNMTIVESSSGIIVVDPVSTVETARAALDLYYSQRGVKKVVAVIYTHSHVDHYAGVKGVVSQEDVDAGLVRVIAPEGFLVAATSENVNAGTAMSRRMVYLYGTFLSRGELAHVDSGIGKCYPLGTLSMIQPTEYIEEPITSLNVDGVSIEFQLVPGTEAPAEMTLYFKDWDALNSAEIACPLMHNILTLRGAQVRDAKAWSEDLDKTIVRYGDKVQVVFAQHHWPRWGNARVVSYLAGQRDMYRFLHDQTLRLINHGYTGIEIAEMLTMPPSLNQLWYTRGYYGTVSHIAKAIYQKYIGWFDGNPANLQALPPVENGQKLVQYMGGSAAAIEKARQDFERGEYRWVAWVMGQVVFAEPQNWDARLLEADALEQLGYQAEAGTWRNAYLVGAYELRNGIMKNPNKTGNSVSPDSIRAMTVGMIFDYMGIRLNGTKAEGRHIVINWNITEKGKLMKYSQNVENSALTWRQDWLSPIPDVTLSMDREILNALMLGTTTFQAEVAKKNIKVEGNPLRFAELLGILDTFDLNFPIVAH